jgi:hypothetical protein
VEFSVSGVSVAQGQTEFRHPVRCVPSLPAIRGRKCPLNKRMPVGERRFQPPLTNGIARSEIGASTRLNSIPSRDQNASTPPARYVYKLSAF